MQPIRITVKSGDIGALNKAVNRAIDESGLRGTRDLYLIFIKNDEKHFGRYLPYSRGYRMKWKPKHGDIIYVKQNGQVTKSRVIGELYDDHILDIPGDILSQSKWNHRHNINSIFANHSHTISEKVKRHWEDWHYDLLESVKARLKNKDTYIEEKNRYIKETELESLKYGMKYYGTWNE